LGHLLLDVYFAFADAADTPLVSSAFGSRLRVRKLLVDAVFASDGSAEVALLDLRPRLKFFTATEAFRAS